MTLKDKLLALGCAISMGFLLVAPSYSVYQVIGSDIAIDIGFETGTTYSVRFYKFASSSATTPTLEIEWIVSGGTKLSSNPEFEMPSRTETLGYYRYQNCWSTSTSYTDSYTSSEVADKIITSNMTFYPIYTGYFAAESASSSTKVGLSYVSTDTYKSSESTYSSTSYHIYKNIKGTSTYEAVSDEKTIYCDAVSGATTGKYTFNYDSSTQETNAMRKFYFQSSNNDFPYGYTPLLHLYTNNSSGTAIADNTWPGASMSWIKDLTYDKVWSYDVDATLYQTFQIVKDSGGYWAVSYGSYGDSLNFRSGTNYLAYSWSSAPSWSTYSG